MPDKRAHRGPDPRDGEAFGPPAWPALRGAVADFSWLLGRSYAPLSALKLVGDRWSLTERQRQAVRRAACSDDARDRRTARQVTACSICGKNLVIAAFLVALVAIFFALTVVRMGNFTIGIKAEDIREIVCEVGEGTVLRPVFGLETGFVSNVYYVPNNPTGAGLLRLLAQIGTGSLTGARLSPEGDPTSEGADRGSFQYRADVRASYDLLLSGTDVVPGTGGLGLGTR